MFFLLVPWLFFEAACQTDRWNNHFPPKELLLDLRYRKKNSDEAVAEWFRSNFVTLPDPPDMTDRERELARWSAAEFMEARRAGSTTCAEYAKVLTKRALHYKSMNQFMYWDIMPEQTDAVIAAAEAMDAKANSQGISAIAPLYCLPVPLKGSMATVEMPSSLGFGLLHSAHAIRDASAVVKLQSMNGLPFGKTNIPEWSFTWVTCNHANGCTLNPYSPTLTTGGSSGGSASAVASYIAPVAITEDTGGSTRHPAVQNGNFGYDPSFGRYPNTGTAALSDHCDQVGINARSMADILAFDEAFLGAASEHAAARSKAKSITNLKVGLPRFPFVDWKVPDAKRGTWSGGANPYWQSAPEMRPASSIMAKYTATRTALQEMGATLVLEEWPSTDSGMNTLEEIFFRSVGSEQSFNAGCRFKTRLLEEWMKDYLAEDDRKTLDALIDDTYSIGDGSLDARELLNGWRSTPDHDMNAFREELVDAYNSYFDSHGVDLIMTPAQFCDALTYECVTASTCVAQVPDASGNFKDSGTLDITNCNLVPFGWFKNIPVPKITVPVGVDDSNRPVSMAFWGRSGPAGASNKSFMYADATKDVDLDFLYAVDTLVKTLYDRPDLRRHPAALVSGPGNLFNNTVMGPSAPTIASTTVTPAASTTESAIDMASAAWTIWSIAPGLLASTLAFHVSCSW